MNGLFFRALSGLGLVNRLSVLIFHRVHATTDALFPSEPDAVTFESNMRWVRDCFNILPLAEALQRLEHDSLPPRAMAITFDDGYADNHDVALPILQRLGLNATFFISTGFLNGGRMWNDSLIETVRGSTAPALDASAIDLPPLPLGSIAERRAAVSALIGKIKYLPIAQRLERVAQIAETAQVRLPTDLMMTSDQVRALRKAGMGVGAHTINHPILASVDIDTARREIAEGRAQLETILGEKVGLFAYPNGRPNTDYRAEHVALVRELGFDAAVSTAAGAASARDDLFQIPRFTPWQWQRWRAGMLLARNVMQGPQALAA